MPIPPKRTERWLRSLKQMALQAAAVLAVVLAMSFWNARGAARGSAPPLSGTDIEGRPTSLEALRGRPVLVHFWASWCSVCKLEQSSIDALARDHAVLTVAAGSGGAEAVGAYLRSQGLSFPALADPEAGLAQRFGVRAFPTSFIVDPQGVIRFVEVGYTTSLGLRARLWWAGR
jgi:thiol-disulfide isomerase/thioredoxin